MLLRQHSPRVSRSAFTLMEMLVVVAIIVALAGIGGFFLLGQLESSKEDLARTQVTGPLSTAVQSYYIKHKTWPPSLAVLAQKDDLTGRPWLESIDAITDPWGKPYQYDANGGMNNGLKPDIYTVTPSNKKIGNWSQQAHQGQ